MDAVVAPATTLASDVKEGSIVKAIHLEYWIGNFSATTVSAQFVAVMEKVPANQAGVTFAQITNLGAYLNKKNILWTSQGVLSPSIDGGITIPVIRDWLKVPKGKQRMGQGDRLIFSIAAIGGILRECGLTTYKEYT